MVIRHVEQEIDKILDCYLEGVLTTDEVRLLHRQLDADLPSGDVQYILDRIELPDDLLYGSDNPKEVKIRYQRALPANVVPQALQLQRSWLLYGVFGLLLLLLPLLFYVLPIQQHQKIFDRYFVSYSITSIPQQFNDQALEEQWHTAVFKYKNEHYLQTVKTLESLLTQPNIDTYAIHFYIGISYLAMSESERALSHLVTVAADINPLCQQANWYIALAHLQLNDITSTQAILRSIIETPDAYNREEAMALLANL